MRRRTVSLEVAALAGMRSRAAAVARDKDAWLAVFADDAVVALRAFWELDKATASARKIQLSVDV